ncbi:MAG: cupin domain-containing protein [Bacteroidota bacterium]|nr:cupin domain-containing protein [Bacteroidota bacterium]
MENILNLFDDMNWENADGYPKGTKRKVLRNDAYGKTYLLKLPKGFFMPLHSHITVEQDFVLEGEYTSQGVRYTKGSYQSFSVGDEHGPFESKNGALVLVIWDSIPEN